LDLASSIIIGDRLSDVWAGKRAGIGTRILLCSGGGEMPDAQYHHSDSLEDIRQRFFKGAAVCPGTKEKYN
jgi:histidinol phosphatase-like enzyme